MTNRDPIGLTRNVIFAAAGGKGSRHESSKYAGILADAAEEQFTWNPLSRKYKGRGPFQVEILDRHSQKKDILEVPQHVVDYLTQGAGEMAPDYSWLVSRANELAPDYAEARSPAATTAKPKRQGPSVLSRVLDSKPIRDLKSTVRPWGMLGTLALGTVLGVGQGYRIAAEQDINEEVRKTAAIAYSGINGSSPIGDFNLAEKHLKEAQADMADGAISKGDVRWDHGLGDFRGNIERVAPGDVYAAKLNALAIEAIATLNTKHEIHRTISNLEHSINQVPARGMPSEERNKLYSLVGDIKKRLKKSAPEIRSDEPLAINISETVDNYLGFLQGMRDKGYINQLALERVRKNYQPKAGAVIGGFLGLMGGFAALIPFLAWEERRDNRKLKAEKERKKNQWKGKGNELRVKYDMKPMSGTLPGIQALSKKEEEIKRQLDGL